MAYKALRAINIRKSAGPDRVPNVIWKTFAFEVAPVIHDLYNTSLAEGLVPSCLKESTVIPTLKVFPPKTIQEDLRPIALTRQLAKILEGFTLYSLMKEVAHLIDPKQFSTQGKSTTHALVYLLYIFSALDRGEIYARVFFADFSKGFDLVDHNVILYELEILGVNQLLINWIGSFLSQRSQQVKIAGTLSPSVKPHGGIPQGTKVAPFLFAILVNNLASEWPTRVKYVDDTSVLELLPRVSTSYLLIIAGNIGRYATQRGMRLNPKKCKEIVINPLQYTPSHWYPLTS